jgi:hypothetical protein
MDEKFLKLTNTTYQLLEYFPETDSLKVRAKEKVLAVMEGLVLASVGDLNQGKLSGDIEILLGYLKVGKAQGWISSMNYLIVCNEYKKICGKPDVPQTEDAQTVCTQKGGEVVVGVEALEIEAPNFLNKMSGRQQKILRFLKDKEKAQVVDLQEILPTVTKRTIRRDLEELLNSGQIVRLGEFNQVFYKVS